MNEMRMVMEKGYMISDASKMLEVENHVLRYWEEELELPIPRNELGHRYYRESEIKLLRSVKDLKEQGFQLKAIKKLLPDLERVEHMDPKILYQLREDLNNQVMREAMEHTKGSVTSIEHARDRYEKRQKTWQEKSYELEQSKEKGAGMQPQYGQTQAASLERLRQFEAMMRQMIRSSVEEVSQESEQRICEEAAGTTASFAEGNFAAGEGGEKADRDRGRKREYSPCAADRRRCRGCKRSGSSAGGAGRCNGVWPQESSQSPQKAKAQKIICEVRNTVI